MNIPATVWDTELNPKAILCYGHITVLANKGGFCYANNKYFEQKLGVSTTTVGRYLNELEDLGVIKRTLIYAEDGKTVKERRIYLNTAVITSEHSPIITDEQSPEYEDIDDMIAILLPSLQATNEDEPVSYVFNCQMGRGRTTTGMVICCLLIGLLQPEFYTDLEEKYPKLWEDNETPWSKGNYKCVLQLKAILNDGREAKKRLDLVLEACNKMQNLRSAVEGFKNDIFINMSESR